MSFVRDSEGRSPLIGDMESISQTLSELVIASDEESTHKRLRESLEKVAALGFEVPDDTGPAVEAMRTMHRALCRAEGESERRLRNLAGEVPDAVREELGSTADPPKVLLFLLRLSKAIASVGEQAASTARALTRLSSSFAGAALADGELRQWFEPRDQDGLPQSVSYSLASALRWAVWDASWLWVNTRRGCADAEEDTRRWDRGAKAIRGSMELPPEPLELLVQAAWAAAAHCCLARFPGGKTGPHGHELRSIEEYRADFEASASKMLMSAVAAPRLCRNLKWLIWNIAWYAPNKACRYNEDAQEALVRASRHMSSAVRGGRAAWRGVNLGGWFLLEPGPCETFWQTLPEDVRQAPCEWSCCEGLGREEAERRLAQHRETYFCKEEFEKMRRAGLTHVRLPFGAWCVTGPRDDEPYIGPCLHHLDKALDELEACGFRVLLDLHGAVGGESASPPCGHKDEAWTPQTWDPLATLAALRVVAERYAGRPCICGVGVANEPSTGLAAADLAQFYVAAVQTVRQAGMAAGEVAVLLPIFPEYRAAEFLELWEQGYPMYEDCVFDVHLYQCFGDWWGKRSLEEHMKLAEERTELLESLPACCVSEWSLDLPSKATQDLDAQGRRDAMVRFAAAQLNSYEVASHGWFFWTWKDSAHIAWSLRDCLQAAILRLPTGLSKGTSGAFP